MWPTLKTANLNTVILLSKYRFFRIKYCRSLIPFFPMLC